MMKWFGHLTNDQGSPSPSFSPSPSISLHLLSFFLMISFLGHILKRIVAVAQQPWFHGEMERQACETLLANIKVPFSPSDCLFSHASF